MGALSSKSKPAFVFTVDRFLLMVLPNNDPQLRAKCTQRQNFQVYPEERLHFNVEFELSRLLEKEIHFLLKFEEDKRALESCKDFNTVAVWTVLDPKGNGFIDFESIRAFFCKYNTECMKEDILAVLRRLTVSADTKISFREFALAITPDSYCLDDAAAAIEFNIETK